MSICIQNLTQTCATPANIWIYIVVVGGGTRNIRVCLFIYCVNLDFVNFLRMVGLCRVDDVTDADVSHVSITSSHLNVRFSAEQHFLWYYFDDSSSANQDVPEAAADEGLVLFYSWVRTFKTRIREWGRRSYCLATSKIRPSSGLTSIIYCK